MKASSNDSHLRDSNGNLIQFYAKLDVVPLKFQRHDNMLKAMKEHENHIQCCGCQMYCGIWCMIILLSLELIHNITIRQAELDIDHLKLHGSADEQTAHHWLIMLVVTFIIGTIALSILMLFYFIIRSNKYNSSDHRKIVVRALNI